MRDSALWKLLQDFLLGGRLFFSFFFLFLLLLLENEKDFLASMNWRKVSRFEKVDGDIDLWEHTDLYDIYAHLPWLPKPQARVLMLLGRDIQGEDNFTPLVQTLATFQPILAFDSGELCKKYFPSYKVGWPVRMVLRSWSDHMIQTGGYRCLCSLRIAGTVGKTLNRWCWSPCYILGPILDNENRVVSSGHTVFVIRNWFDEISLCKRWWGKRSWCSLSGIIYSWTSETGV